MASSTQINFTKVWLSEFSCHAMYRNVVGSRSMLVRSYVLLVVYVSLSKYSISWKCKTLVEKTCFKYKMFYILPLVKSYIRIRWTTIRVLMPLLHNSSERVKCTNRCSVYRCQSNEQESCCNQQTQYKWRYSKKPNVPYRTYQGVSIVFHKSITKHISPSYFDKVMYFNAIFNNIIHIWKQIL